ncbi:MAG: ATP-binding cassette domain-containing protein, partial [Candidatus Hodarchaeales archaeon]
TNLHPSFSLIDNIKLPFLLQGKQLEIDSSLDMFRALDISEKIGSYPLQLSGGEKQRAGLVVALTGGPKMILLDEPTAHVESTLALRMIDFILNRAKEHQLTVILATHDLTLLRPGMHLISLDSGRKISDTRLDEREQLKHQRREKANGSIDNGLLIAPPLLLKFWALKCFHYILPKLLTCSPIISSRHN